MKNYVRMTVCLCITAFVVTIGTFSVHAASEFDSVYYAAAYPDVAATVGTEPEGRCPYAGAQPGEMVSGISGADSPSADVGAAFDPNYYANNYPDMVAAFGTETDALLTHYLNCGMAEGRYPYAGAAPGAAVSSVLNIPVEVKVPTSPFVPVNELANLQSIRKRMTDAELNAAYQAALMIVAPYADCTREEQLWGIAYSLRILVDSGMTYSMSEPHYNDPYGFFILDMASCAGSTRATGLCLNILGIPYEHVNENQYTHQWCRVEVDGTYWICDPFGLYCGPESDAWYY